MGPEHRMPGECEQAGAGALRLPVPGDHDATLVEHEAPSASALDDEYDAAVRVGLQHELVVVLM